MKSIALWALLGLLSANVYAQPWLEPGNLSLRDDIHTLVDAGAIDVPMTTWPVSWGDIAPGLTDVNTNYLGERELQALSRVKTLAGDALNSDYLRLDARMSGSHKRRVARTFENSPRESAEAALSAQWTGERFAFKAIATGVADASDGESFRPDGSYVGMALGNWMLSAGYQERWWGPGWEGSQILGTNARPFPHLAIQRNRSTPFESKWLSWMGPWTLTSFVGVLDDDREVPDAQVFGLRGTFRPGFWKIRGLEIGVTRTAQLCGQGRSCGLTTYMDMLLGRDNRGVNVAPENEPGNQLGAIDARWASPIGRLPYALYMQWGAEDGRAGPSPLGDFLRQVGAETWGVVAGTQWAHRTHFELSQTNCSQGAIGGSGDDWNCAYNHSIYKTGYRYRGRVMGNGIDNDGLSYSMGATIKGAGDGSWQVLLRHVEFNRGGSSDPANSLSAGPNKLDEVVVSHRRKAFVGELTMGIGYSRTDAPLFIGENDGASVFVEWKTGL